MYTLSFVLLLVTLASSAPTQYFINSTQIVNCYTSNIIRCSFHDPSIWEGDVAPSSFSDAAVMYVPLFFFILYYLLYFFMFFCGLISFMFVNEILFLI